jgi:hypothetical protein
MEVKIQDRDLIMEVGVQDRGLILEVRGQDRGLVLRSRLRLKYVVNFGVIFSVKYDVERLRMRLEFSIKKLKFKAWIQY